MRKRTYWTLLAIVTTTTACTAILGDFSVGTGNDGGTQPGTDSGTSTNDSSLSDSRPPVDSGCPTNETLCADGCMDLQKAATDCSVCGHSCNGGLCTTGVCGSYVIAKQPTTGTVAKVATDGTRVVWADTGIVAIEQIAATGGTVTTLAAVSVPNGAIGSELSIGKTTVAFAYVGASNPPSVGVANLDTPDSGVPVFNGTLEISAVSMNKSGTHVVYVNSHGTQSDLSDCAVNGHTAGTCGPGVGGGRFSSETAVDEGYIFLDLTGANINPSQAGLYVGPIPSDAVNIFTTDVAASLATDGTWAYWTIAADAGPVYAVRRTLESTPGTQLQTPVPTTPSSAFATDGKNVYYWNGSGLAARPVAGGAETVLGAQATAVTSVAAASGLVVWTDGATISGVVLPP